MITAKTERGTIEFTGIRGLMVDVVLQAVRDYDSNNEKLKEEAGLFILSDSFTEICQSINLSYRNIRRKVREDGIS